jgi:SAM-dependent methyltransferase
MRRAKRAVRRRAREWFDDDAFWRDVYPFLFSEARFDDATEETRRVLRLARPRGRAVLDLCCGPGRISIPLAKRGYRVTGVDRTRYLLAKARARARARKVAVEWIREDMRDFVRPGAFDLALSMHTSFGYFDDKREDVRVLGHILENLKPGGAFLIDLMGKERIAQIFTPATTHALPDGTELIHRHEIFDDWTRIRNAWTVLRRGKAKTYRFHHTIYSGQELRDLMERAGFAGVRLYGGFDGEPYGRKSLRLIAVGRRPR